MGIEGRRRSDGKQSPERKLTGIVRELAKSSSDSKLATAAIAMADALDEYEAAFGRIAERLEGAGVKG